ncbi:hypothetical protein [Jiangella sp. DSM 45060]|uniref:hypothetical protein n=1 Tax=Jiangella sp. DSM 45060 TaxID=1798224 RepID=UPI00087B253B|nr:hypothetical protein [Jiangella sp. DSM 45060]SDS46137.1 hypothetical protein SAMN04515669_1153 [Jiangella sp. DSM 45060]
MVSGAALLAYPWEFALDPPAGEAIAAAGVSAVCVAGAYHAVRALRPRGDAPRVVDVPHSAAYWPVEARRYPARLRPAAPPRPWAGSAVAAIGSCRSAGLAAGAWLSVLHSTRLASSAPDLALVNCFGDVYRHALCPAHAEVRDYAAALVRDATDRLAPDWVELEAVGYHGFRHASLHDKAGVPVSDDTVYLLSLCFCTACRRLFGARGGDPGRLAGAVRDEVARRLAGGGDAELDVALRAELALLAQMRDGVGAELAAAAAEPARSAGLPVAVHVGVSPQTVGSRSPLTPALAGLADAVVVSTDGRAPDDAARDLAGAVAAAGDACAVLASVRAFPPDVRSCDEVARRVQDAAAAGAAGARVHTFGLIPDERLEWIGSVAAW